MVTDVLVTHGNREVVTSVASNHGARFSELGFLHMVDRAEGDTVLAEKIGRRADIPKHVFQQLIAKASDDVKKRLQHERPDMAGQIQSAEPMSPSNCSPESARIRRAIRTQNVCWRPSTRWAS